jgi:hypothetical protein
MAEQRLAPSQVWVTQKASTLKRISRCAALPQALKDRWRRCLENVAITDHNGIELSDLLDNVTAYSASQETGLRSIQTGILTLIRIHESARLARG